MAVSSDFSAISSSMSLRPRYGIAVKDVTFEGDVFGIAPV